MTHEYPEVDPLTKLAILHGCNKGNIHAYTPFYHDRFNHLRNQPIRLLEIGVGGYEFRKIGGFSMAMWADYFPLGQIVGIDIAEKDLNLGPRVKVIRGEQNDVAFLARVVAEHGPFDIIIDDGSHVPQHIVTSFWSLFPSLTDHGYYVIEDIQTSFWPDFGGSPIGGGETLKLAQVILQALNHKEVLVSAPDWHPPSIAPTIRSFTALHNLFIVEKGDNTDPSVARTIAVMERELGQAPSANGLALLGAVYGMTGAPREGLETVKRALERWPDHVRLLVSAARLAGPAGEPETARSYVERAVALDPTAETLYRLIGH